MEARIARLESDVAHLVASTADVKAELRQLRDKIDAMHIKLMERIDGVAKDLNAQIEKLNGSIAGIKVWVLTLQLSIGGAILAAMARGFGWI